MKFAVGSDHAGYGLKESLKETLRELGHEIEDIGTDSEKSVDYPDFAAKVAVRVSKGEADRGLLVCGTGIGMSMAANKVSGVRAALCTDRNTAEMSRKHNDANVLCVGARVVSRETAMEILKAWLGTEFEGGRHERRVGKIMKLDDPATSPHP